MLLALFHDLLKLRDRKKGKVHPTENSKWHRLPPISWWPGIVYGRGSLFREIATWSPKMEQSEFVPVILHDFLVGPGENPMGETPWWMASRPRYLRRYEPLTNYDPYEVPLRWCRWFLLHEIHGKAVGCPWLSPEIVTLSNGFTCDLFDTRSPGCAYVASMWCIEGETLQMRRNQM